MIKLEFKKVKDFNKRVVLINELHILKPSHKQMEQAKAIAYMNNIDTIVVYR